VSGCVFSISEWTPTSRPMVTVLVAVAPFEREIMLERQREGIRKAKSAGRYKGRKTHCRRTPAECYRHPTSFYALAFKSAALWPLPEGGPGLQMFRTFGST
jgi:hypothetical protein